ncbi:MAG: RnfABCDGE type electron transport complex subunit A [Clostridia bacterium]|nr:RnfABCDGE type electron transport complex subunit A [Clostridia bacterium]
MSTFLVIVIGQILVNNYVMCQFYGICPFLGVSKRVDTALGMGMAVTFVITIASFVTRLLQFALDALSLQYLQTIVFILVIAVLVQVVESALKKLSPSLYQALGVYLPLITTNCVVLAVAQKNISTGYGLLESTLCGFCAALGFTLALVLLAGIRERMEESEMPTWMKGFPGALIMSGLMAMAFMGFNGLI